MCVKTYVQGEMIRLLRKGKWFDAVIMEGEVEGVSGWNGEEKGGG